MAPFNNTLSLYIPRVVDTWASVDAISPIFEQLGIGTISRIDFVQKQSENSVVYYQAFLYFSEWHDTPSAHHLQERIMQYAENPDDTSAARIVYDDPWYWLLFVNAHPVTEAERDLRQRLQVVEKFCNTAWQWVQYLETQNQNNAYWASCALGHANSLQNDVDFLMAHLGLSNQNAAAIPHATAVPNFRKPSPLVRSVNHPLGGSWPDASQPEPLDWHHDRVDGWALQPAAAGWEAPDETADECSGNWVTGGGWWNEEMHEDDDEKCNCCAENDEESMSGVPTSTDSPYSSAESEDEDEGLMPFVHTPDEQRPRAMTEEGELEERRRQKPAMSLRNPPPLTPPAPDFEGEDTPLHGTIRTDDNGDTWRWNNNYSKWFMLYRKNPIVDQDCCMGV